jgi:hypothetical protein
VVRAAKWVEFEGIDWNDESASPGDPIWRIPPERLKLDMDSRDDQAFEHLVLGLSVDQHPVLAHPRSENTIGYMYARNGYSGRHVPRGWRATFCTIMNERAIPVPVAWG